jgi:hypothetical protein
MKNFFVTHENIFHAKTIGIINAEKKFNKALFTEPHRVDNCKNSLT